MSEAQPGGGTIFQYTSPRRKSSESIDSRLPHTYENVELRNPSNYDQEGELRTNFSGAQYPYYSNNQQPVRTGMLNNSQNRDFFQNNDSFQSNQGSFVPDCVPMIPPRQPTEAWKPLYSEQSLTSSGGRKSLDETHNHYFQRPSPSTNNFVRRHRRGRSDEVAYYFEGTPTMPRAPTRFGSPPLMRANQLDHFSQSTTALDQPNYNSGMMYNHGTPMHSLHHSASVDNSYGIFLNENLYRQNTAYVNLTTSITLSQRKLKELENGVKGREQELNKLLSVQKNPTEKEYRQLKDEVNILHREISEMYNECDKHNIDPSNSQGLSRRPIPPILHTPSPTKQSTIGTGGYREQNPVFPCAEQQHTSIITKQPLPNVPSLTGGPPPAYDTLNHFSGPQTPNKYISKAVAPKRPPPLIPGRPTPVVVPPQRPGPMPPQRPTPPQRLIQPQQPPTLQPQAAAASLPDDNEHWVCPSCTFRNLVVNECEVCYTPRPGHLPSRHS
jgi:hypothetical protein